MPTPIPPVGSLCVLRYRDASYSYRDLLRSRKFSPGIVVSYGKVRRIEPDYIDLAIKWRNDGRTRRGIIVPRAAILSVRALALL